MPSSHVALLVDDKPEILRALGRMLRRLDIDVTTAPNAETAMALLADRDFDIIVTDHDMEGENGLWLLEQAQRLRPSSRRVLMSGRSIPDFEVARERGVVHAFLLKPATRDELAHAVLPDEDSSPEGR